MSIVCAQLRWRHSEVPEGQSQARGRKQGVSTQRTRHPAVVHTPESRTIGCMHARTHTCTRRYVRLPANNYTVLMNAVATLGPVAISLDANFME